MIPTNESTFSWNAYPTNEVEFEVLMVAIDSALSKKGVKPFQRPLHVGRFLWEDFSWGGELLPSKDLANKPGYWSSQNIIDVY